MEGLHRTTQRQTEPLDLSPDRGQTTPAACALGEKVRERSSDRRTPLSSEARDHAARLAHKGIPLNG